MYGPCFSVRFYFQEKQCSPIAFEKVLLADPIVSAPPPLAFPMSGDKPGRCILATSSGEKPLGFIYFCGNRSNSYWLSTYPLQIKRHYGTFYWDGEADDPYSAIKLHAELVFFIRRLHSQLDFHLAVMNDEGAPSFTPPHTSLTGILIYDWLAQQGDFGASEFVGYCYALLPLEQAM